MEPSPRARILIVDDSKETREIYADYLSYFGYRVEGVSNAREALALARTLRPDVIILDLSLPGIDGYEATRRLRADTETSQARIVMLTGHLLRGSAVTARKAGADAFLTKPCLPEELLATIERVMRGGG
jgi:two-component system, cell cycle response regulator DivK